MDRINVIYTAACFLSGTDVWLYFQDQIMLNCTFSTSQCTFSTSEYTVNKQKHTVNCQSSDVQINAKREVMLENLI